MEEPVSGCGLPLKARIGRKSYHAHEESAAHRAGPRRFKQLALRLHAIGCGWSRTRLFTRSGALEPVSPGSLTRVCAALRGGKPGRRKGFRLDSFSGFPRSASMPDVTFTHVVAGTEAPPPVSTAGAWSWLRRVGFRFSFSYWLLYALMNGNITLFLVVPFAGRTIQQFVAGPSKKLAEWIGDHVFHLTGIAARWHGGGSGDTALHWLQVLFFFGLAVVATVVWSAFARRPDYRVMLVWLRWLLRLTLAIAMLYYGFAKLFPLQMRPPSTGILTNTFGNSSPMTLLWTLLGLNPLYQVVCGAAEVGAGLLLLFRPTATAGVIAALALSTNIVLYNFFFDVPVKLFASHLLLMSACLLAPDVPAFWRLFVRGQPARLSGGWTPPLRTTRWTKGLIMIEAVFAVSLLLQSTLTMSGVWRQHRAALAPTPIMGAWQLDKVEPEDAARPVSPEGEPWVALYIDDQRAGFYRSRDGALWRCGFHYNGSAQKLGIRGVRFSADYTWQRPDAEQLVLSRHADGQTTTLTFRRIDTAAGFPLLQRGFHWVNEWGYER
jgi:hypothetical protein